MRRPRMVTVRCTALASLLAMLGFAGPSSTTGINPGTACAALSRRITVRDKAGLFRAQLPRAPLPCLGVLVASALCALGAAEDDETASGAGLISVTTTTAGMLVESTSDTSKLLRESMTNESCDSSSEDSLDLSISRASTSYAGRHAPGDVPKPDEGVFLPATMPPHPEAAARAALVGLGWSEVGQHGRREVFAVQGRNLAWLRWSPGDWYAKVAVRETFAAPRRERHDANDHLEALRLVHLAALIGTAPATQPAEAAAPTAAVMPVEPAPAATSSRADVSTTPTAQRALRPAAEGFLPWPADLPLPTTIDAIHAHQSDGSVHRLDPYTVMEPTQRLPGE